MLKHTEKWWKAKYIQTIRAAEREGLKNPFRNEDQFKATWEYYHDQGVKDIYSKLKYDMKYQTGYKTALAFYQHLKEITDDDPGINFEQVKKYSTQELAEMFKDALLESYEEERQRGKSAKDAKEFVSELWYGSSK